MLYMYISILGRIFFEFPGECSSFAICVDHDLRDFGGGYGDGGGVNTTTLCKLWTKYARRFVCVCDIIYLYLAETFATPEMHCVFCVCVSLLVAASACNIFNTMLYFERERPIHQQRTSCHVSSIISLGISQVRSRFGLVYLVIY